MENIEVVKCVVHDYYSFLEENDYKQRRRQILRQLSRKYNLSVGEIREILEL